MNWKKLRPLLRNNFGKNFGFYNDLYKSGTRKIKIYTSNPTEILNFIKTITPQLDSNLFETEIYGTKYLTVTIHYR